MTFHQDLPFPELLCRVLAGDRDAADVLVQKYARILRAYVRVRLTSPRIRRHLDTADITQEVWCSFFARLRKGAFKLDSAAQLVGLLVGMARRRLAKWVRFWGADRRNVERLDEAPVEEHSVAGTFPDPALEAEWHEFRELLQRWLSVDEWRAFELCLAHHTWQQIADLLGGTPDAWRMRLHRALLKVLRDLGTQDLP